MGALDEATILCLGSEPIPGPDPGGGDITDDPDRDLVIQEFKKYGRIDATSPPDWGEIEFRASLLLKEKAKDIDLAVALSAALFQQHQYRGLAAAIGLIGGLIEHFWDVMHPPRPRRRKGQIEGFLELFVERGWFRENQAKPGELDAIRLIEERAQQLEAIATERFGAVEETPPNLKRFISGISEIRARLEPASTPAPAPAAQPNASASAQSPGSVAPSASFAVGAPADTDSAIKALRDVSRELSTLDPTSAFPYVVFRVLRWRNATLPDSAAGTTLRPPEGEMVLNLREQRKKSLWSHLLDNAESAFRVEDPLWLDLQWYACEAMANLGSDYELAREHIMALTGSLVRRIGEGIFDLRFEGGEPLCSGEARMWIESKIMHAAGGSPGGGNSSTAGNGRFASATKEARELAGGGKILEAVKRLQKELSESSQQRDKLLWKLQIARLCCDCTRSDVAAPLLEDCRDLVREHGVDQWEPELAIDVARTLYRCRKGLLLAASEPDRELADESARAFAWLCQLDPGAALSDGGA